MSTWGGDRQPPGFPGRASGHREPPEFPWHALERVLERGMWAATGLYLLAILVWLAVWLAS